jgi:hypothetical protein
VSTVDLLHDDARHTYGGPGVAEGKESVSDPKDSARRIDSDAGQNSPYATVRHKRCEKK